YVSNPKVALTSIPFLIFFSWLAVLNLVGYSLAGEKMPWLGTHLSLPLIFLTAWYFGRIISKIKWRRFAERGWVVLALLIVFLVALSRVIQPLLMGTPPFAGLSQDQLQATYSWLGALVVVAGSLAAVFYVRESVGWKHVRQLLAVVVFGLLSVITFRSAWLASFVNYDYATEFLVYAHAAPGVKWVLDDIEELSLRTTDGYDLAIAYDNEVSWPYSWYFRNYTNVTYVGENPTVQNLQDAVVVVVGAAHLGAVEPILEDRYVRYDHIRLWWPMQDYFYLTPDRVNNLLDFSAANPTAAQIRQGIFDIWWSRDYGTYGDATNKNFDVTNWPVSDKMHFYVRRDIAAQIWPYGVGDGTVLNPLDEIEVNQCNANWQDMSAVQVLEAPDGMTNPIGISIAPDGTIYVAEEFGHRISAFDSTGAFIESMGQEGTLAMGDTLEFNRPNSLSIGEDGTIYIADTWNYRVQILQPDLTPIDFFGQPGTYGFDAPVSPTEGLWGPRDVAVSADGRIFVSDTGNKRVRVYRVEDGVALHQYDIAAGGSAPGQLDEPSGLVISDDGRLFVADTWNRRVSVFTLHGSYLDSYNVRGWYEELGNRPYLAIDENRGLLYVTDPDAGRVLVYTLAGDCVGSFGQAAAAAPTLGQFGVAAGVAVDDEGFVYVVDNRFGRVLKFLPFPYDAGAVNAVEESQLDAVESQEQEAIVTEEVNAQE
ncbi:MAG: SMP-30/gluconolactonase/LRE family protein, partial [Anaerolineae bacterium]|nr:SMP-30/gluconolactonase/LRE family protein [Anaerolineae bacterium]